MKIALFSLLLLVSLPLTASAAGFAKQSLFLSKTPVTEGETVLIHAVLANDATTAFTGNVIFKDSDTSIGSVAVSLAAQGSTVASVSWKPSAGSHNITAELTAGDGSVVESESATFLINEKPLPADVLPATSTPVGSSQDIQQSIAGFSPTAANLSAPIFSTLDSVRASAAGALDEGINWAKQQSASKPGQILGASTQSASAIGSATGIFATILLYVLTALRYFVGNAGIFYPVFAIFFFYILWRIYRRMRRPSYSSAM